MNSYKGEKMSHTLNPLATLAGIFLVSIFTLGIQAQPSSKSSAGVSVGLIKYQTFIPINYSIYFRLNILTKNLSTRINIINGDAIRYYKNRSSGSLITFLNNEKDTTDISTGNKLIHIKTHILQSKEILRSK